MNDNQKPNYYAIKLNFNIQSFLEKYFKEHPDLDRTFFDQLVEKKRIPSVHHVTIVHENAKKDKNRFEEAQSLWEKCKKMSKEKTIANVVFDQLVYDSKTMGLVVKEIKPSEIKSWNKIPHVTVATIDESVKNRRTNEMLEKTLIEKNSDAKIIKLDKEVQISGVIEGLTNSKKGGNTQQNKVTSLYELIKQKVKEKGRPLKILADWDECLFSFRATAVYKFGTFDKDFKQFFSEFWDKIDLDCSSLDSSEKFNINKPGPEKEAWDRFTRLTAERKKASDPNAEKYHVVTNIQATSPFLSMSEDLLKCLKEGLISELIVLTATRNTKKKQISITIEEKKKRFSKNFAKFPQCKFEILNETFEKIGRKIHRWEWVRDSHPDFDIYIDDSPKAIVGVNKYFSDQTYVMPNYRFAKETQGDNIYHVKTTVSDLKDEDFAKAAEEYKQKQAGKLTSRAASAPVSERERNNIWKQPALYWGLAGGIAIATCLGLIIYWLLKKSKNNNKTQE